MKPDFDDPLKEAHILMMTLRDSVSDYAIYKNYLAIGKLGEVNGHLATTLMSLSTEDLAGDMGKRLIIAFPECFSLEHKEFSVSVGDLDLSTRARKVIQRLCNLTQYDSVEALLKRSPKELLEVKNCGLITLNEIKEKLAQFGWKLAGD